MITTYINTQTSSFSLNLSRPLKEPCQSESPSCGLNAEQPKQPNFTGSDVVSLSLSGLDKSKSADKVEAPSAIPGKPLNPFAAAILSAISGQLTLDVTDGASQEELQSRLEAGLDGFLAGFKEGFAQVSAMDGMNDDIKSQILETKAQVLAGLSDLADELGLSKEKLTKADTNFQEELKTLSNRNQDNNGKQSNVTGLDAFNEAGGLSSTENSFSFSLTTADGDKINILASSLKAMQLDKSGNSLSLSGDQKSQFSFTVDGDLDEDELKAINDLLNQVSQVSETFFNGNVEQAFEQAINMGFDSQEITSYALKLTQSSFTQVQGTYKNTGSYENTKPLLSKNLVHLGDFLKELEKANLLAADMNQSSSLISELADKILAVKQLGEPTIAGFIEKLPQIATSTSRQDVLRSNTTGNIA